MGRLIEQTFAIVALFHEIPWTLAGSHIQSAVLFHFIFYLSCTASPPENSVDFELDMLYQVNLTRYCMLIECSRPIRFPQYVWCIMILIIPLSCVKNNQSAYGPSFGSFNFSLLKYRCKRLNLINKIVIMCFSLSLFWWNTWPCKGTTSE